MANNRLFLRCRACGEEVLVAKHFVGEWGVFSPPHDKLDDRLDDFFRKHYLKHAQEDAFTPTNTFELSYEENEPTASSLTQGRDDRGSK